MGFPVFNLSFLISVLILLNSLRWILSSDLNGLNEMNNTIFLYQDVQQCKRNEYYDLDFFKCVACNDDSLRPSENKFSCQCTATTTATATSPAIIELYDSNHAQPICLTFANNCNNSREEEEERQQKNTSVTSTRTLSNACVANENEIGMECLLKYINTTSRNDLEHQFNYVIASDGDDARLPISVKHLKATNSSSDCLCDLTYNFQYQDYCIANELMKPYLHYNSFWQFIGGGVAHHFGELKFVAFFCLRLRNATACNQLANLCVLSHFSLDKNSPCNAFLLTQSTDVILRFASGVDEHLHSLRPFLFFKKGQQTAKMLGEPIEDSNGYDLSKNERMENSNHEIKIMTMTYNLNGSFQRRGSFLLSHINLCGLYGVSGNFLKSIPFGKRLPVIECTLSLEDLMDLGTQDKQKNFISFFLNYTNTRKPNRRYLHSIPILIENLTTENEGTQPTEWLLVKRLQMIATQPRLLYGTRRPHYEDTHKLQLYRSLRYVEKFQLHYEIHDHNRIAVPILRLRYRNIEIHPNTTLDSRFNFRLEVTFSRAADNKRREILNETVLPLMLLTVTTISMLRAYNYRKRRRAVILNGQAMDGIQAMPMELCDFRAVLEFLLQMCSSVAFVLLLCFLLHILYDATQFLTQRTVAITLPLIREESNTLEILIYVAVFLKLTFICFHLWRNSHFDLFFIDWERPRSFDNNHFNLKSNLETSSVCSSVRTFIAENNVSAWRIFFTANEWLRLSFKKKTSMLMQGLGVLAAYKFFNIDNITQDDLVLQLYFIILIYLGVYCLQHVYGFFFAKRLKGDPMHKFADLCSWANVSVFILLEPSYGYYIHGRSPHGFADTDMSSMIMQLQRESQSMCGRRGLLSDSDQQTYIILPPTNLRTYFHRLLVPFQRSCSISQAHFQKESSTLSGGGGGAATGLESNLERTFIAYSSVNRFFCAFIDHAIKDMDYIIKEKTFLEKLLDCEFENYLTENKGTFYIDNSNAFSQLFLYGNEFHIFLMEFLLFLMFFLKTQNLIFSVVFVCAFDVLSQWIFSLWMKRNLSKKTLIDQRFLM